MKMMDESAVHETSRTVGQVFKVVGGGTPATSVSKFWQGSIPWITSADLDEHLKITPRKAITKEAIDASATNLVPSGSVIVATRVGLGKVGVAQEPLCFSQDCQGLVLDLKTCDPRFVALQLKQRVQIFKHISRGTTISGVTKQQLLDLPFELPLLTEQQRIVAEIEKQFSRLDEAVASFKRVKANLKRYKASVLKAAVEGKLTEDWRKAHPDIEPASKLLERILAERRAKWTGRGKYKEPVAPDTNDLPPLAEEWTWTALEQLSWDSSYGTSVKCSYENSGPTVLRIPNIESGKLDFGDIKHAPKSFEIEQGKELSIGDVLIIRTNGSRSLIGRSAVIRQPIPSRSTYASYLIRFRLMQQSEVIAWVSTVWDADFFRQWIEQRAATSAGQHNISMTVLATLPMPLPPLAEQEQIVAEVERRLSVIEELEASVEANLTRADRLRQSILANAFAGKLVRDSLREQSA